MFYLNRPELWSRVSGFIHSFHLKKTTLAGFFFQFGANDWCDNTSFTHCRRKLGHPKPIFQEREPRPGAPQQLQWSPWGSCLPDPQSGICCHNLHNKHLPSNADWDSLLLTKKYPRKSFHFWLAKVSFKKCSNKTGLIPTLTDFKLGWLTVGLLYDAPIGIEYF